MKDLISVIVPIYNAEKYIAKCVDSILLQTYKNFELILIDDGSIDNSGKICDEYAEKDGRVRVIHKKNGGVSVARNTGIEAARGEFISFVDSDDWLNESSLEILLKALNEENADLASGAFDMISKKGIRHFCSKRAIYTENEIAENIISIFYLNSSVWGNLYKKEMILKNNIRFDKDVPIGEDSTFSMRYVKECSKIILIEDCVYNYNRIVSTSAMMKYYEKWDEYQSHIFNAAKNVVESKVSDKDKKKRLIAVLANKFSCNAAEHYVGTSFINIKVKRKLESILNYYRQYLDVTEFGNSNIKCFSKSAFELFAKNDIEGFVKQWKRDLKSDGIYYKHYIKLLMKKFKLI